MVCSVQVPRAMIDPSENGLFDIPDYEHIEDEAFPPMPPPLSPGEGNLEEHAFANGDGNISAHLSGVIFNTSICKCISL